MAQSSALCGPRQMAHALGIELLEAQSICEWIDGEGTEPEGLAAGGRAKGYEAEVVFNTTLEAELAYLKAWKRHKPHVFLCFWSLRGDSPPDGHYVEFRGLDENGDVMVWDGDYPDAEFVTMPRPMFETFWYDYRIHQPHKLLKRCAIRMHLPENGRRRRKGK